MLMKLMNLFDDEDKTSCTLLNDKCQCLLWPTFT